ncbi:MAG TPA: ATP-binding protein [Leptolyngbyaceae cyanobacterium]
MQFQESGFSIGNVEDNIVGNPLDRDRSNTLNFPKNTLKTAFDRLSIAKKIRYGYSLAIAIAVFGTSIGLAIGDFYRKQAYQQLIIADGQQQLLSELKNGVNEMRSHPQRLVTTLGESIWFDYENAKFNRDVNRVYSILSDLKNFIENYSSGLLINDKSLTDLLYSYQTTTEAYDRQVKLLWQALDPPNLKPEQIPAAQQELLTFIKSKTATNLSVKFERLSETLNLIEQLANSQKKQADERLLEAEAIRLQIIVGSMVLSVVFATILGFYTSRQIARPIEWVNHVALRVTQQSNFKLIAPVFSNDEVGSLANSINQLVKWVGSYTQELELARQTLEQRVEERTKELQQTLQELKQTQSQLIQSEKMSSLGQLVAGIAHEINNPVNFIYGNLEYTKTYTEGLIELVNLYQQSYPCPILAIEEKIEEIDLPFLEEDLPKIVSSMKMGTERIRQIVLSLRNFSRLDEAEMKAVDIHEGIENTLLILNNRLKRGIGVMREYGDLPLVECYPAQLNQVFMNIIANAIDAFEQVKNTDATEKCSRSPKIVISTKKVEGNHIRVSIRDNGSGISPEIKNKLFDPFFTTKPMGKGTGLGLSISYQIVEKHQGKIDVISELGEGTEFIIKLPSKQ